MSNKNPKKNATPGGPKKPITQENKDSQIEADKQVKEAEKLLKVVTRDSLNDKRERESYENKLEKAFQYVSKACSINPTNSKAFFYRGKCYYHMGDFQRALYDFSVAIRIEEVNKAEGRDYKRNDLAEYYNFAGVQHFELGQLDEAL